MKIDKSKPLEWVVVEGYDFMRGEHYGYFNIAKGVVVIIGGPGEKNYQSERSCLRRMKDVAATLGLKLKGD